MDEEIRSFHNTTSLSEPASLEAGHRLERNTVISACIPCRSKHLKCDGLKFCSRCATQGLQCIYLKSRRGYKGSAKKHRHLSAINSMTNAKEKRTHNDAQYVMPMNMLGMELVPSDPSPGLDFALVNQNWATIQPRHENPVSNIRRRCMEAFFQHFYDAHPFLPPRQHFFESLKVGTLKEHLEIAVAYIGSQYIRGAPQNVFAVNLEFFESQQNLPRDVPTVQTLLLYAIGLDGNNERKKAVEVLIKAQKLTLIIGLNHREYAATCGRGSFVCEESIRRTWWELYVVSVLVGALHGKRVFQLSGVISTTPLPCEAEEFVNGVLPQLYTIEEFDDNSFLEEDIQWSSYAFRIAAARNLERILETEGIVFPDDARTYSLDALLVNWSLHLPPSKVANFDQSGIFDEMMFQAHMITALSSLLLHRQFTTLDTAATQTISSCTAQGTLEAYCSRLGDIHLSKATEAASTISKLVGMPTPLIHHTHFFTCALTHSSISHLSLWSHLPLLAADENVREEIRMNAGALKEMRTVWPSAQTAFSQVTIAAAKIFESRKDAAGDMFWRDLIGTENVDDDLALTSFSDIVTAENP